MDASQARDALMAAALDSLTQSLVPFTALRPSLSPPSFDVATSQRRRNGCA